jgi:hypothetical protein
MDRRYTGRQIFHSLLNQALLVLFALIGFSFFAFGGSPTLAQPEFIFSIVLTVFAFCFIPRSRSSRTATVKFVLRLQTLTPRKSKLQFLDPLLI